MVTVKRYLKVVLCLVMMFSSCFLTTIKKTCAENVQDSYSYSINWELTEDGTLSLTGMGSMSTDTYQPWSAYNEYITKVVIGEGITTVGVGAFQNCVNLEIVELPNTIVSIGYYKDYGWDSGSYGNSFSGCTKLKEINFPDSLESIEANSFYKCTSLENVNLNEGLKRIEGGSFSNCKSLTSISFPSSIQYIGNAFQYCSNLSTLELPDNSTFTVGSNVFYYCTNITKLIVPEKCRLCDSAKILVSSQALNEIVVDENNEMYDSGPDNNYLLRKDIGRLELMCENASIPSNVKIIGANLFEKNLNLVEISLPDGVEEIEENAFYQCQNLEQITLPSTVLKIGKYAFALCDHITNIKLSNNLKEIGHHAFYSCKGISEINFPDSLEIIGESAFESCEKLSNIYLPEGVSSIEKRVFSNCTNLKKIEIDENNVVYDSRNDCNGIIAKSDNKLIFGLNTTIIPNTVNIIGDYAFYSCKGLKQITLPISVKKIGNSAFGYCQDLEKVIFETPKMPDIYYDAFWGTNITALYPESWPVTPNSEEHSFNGKIVWEAYDGSAIEGMDSYTLLPADDYMISAVLDDNVFLETEASYYNEGENVKLITIFHTKYTENQIFKIQEIDDGWCKIYSPLTELVLGIKDISQNNSASVKLFAFDGSDSQLWRLHKVDSNNHCYTIESKTGLYLSIESDQINDNVDVIVEEKNSEKTQQFNIIKANDVNKHLSDIFTDIENGQWYEEYVEYVVQNNLMQGYTGTTNFGPENTVTREMMVQVLYNMAGRPEVTDYTATTKFWDVYEGAWFEDAVCWAYNNGITTGMDGGFGTEKNMTREQMVRFLRNYAKFAGYNISSTTSITDYPDYKEVDDWAKEDMAWGVATGMISGVTSNNVNYLQPLGNATRAQLATVLTRYCKKNNVEVTHTDNISTVDVYFEMKIPFAIENIDDYANIKIEKGAKIVQPSNPISKIGSFKGWYTSEDYTEKFYFDQNIDMSTTIYAKWELNELDTDKDGLTDEFELLLNTSPTLADTDGDGINDYDEIFMNYSPILTDTDGNGICDVDEDYDEDGLSNKEEITLGTLMWDKDTDKDGISDYDEINLYHTDPLKEDTDGDGAKDGWEIDNNYDPLKVNEQFTIVKGNQNEDVLGIDASLQTTISGDEIELIDISKDDSLMTLGINSNIAGYLGRGYRVENPNSNSVVTFKFDNSIGTIGNEFQPRIYFYNEDSHSFEEVKNQTVKEGSVQANIENAGLYMLLNKVEYDLAWSNTPNVKRSLLSFATYLFDDDNIPNDIAEKIYNGEILTTSGSNEFMGINFNESPDFDNDGILNGDEIKIVEVNGKQAIQIVTNPCIADTDFDGYSDKEDPNPTVYNIHPITSSKNYTFINSTDLEDITTTLSDINNKLEVIGNYLYGYTIEDKINNYYNTIVTYFTDYDADMDSRVFNMKENLLFVSMDQLKFYHKLMKGGNTELSKYAKGAKGVYKAINKVTTLKSVDVNTNTFYDSETIEMLDSSGVSYNSTIRENFAKDSFKKIDEEYDDILSKEMADGLKNKKAAFKKFTEVSGVVFDSYDIIKQMTKIQNDLITFKNHQDLINQLKQTNDPCFKTALEKLEFQMNDAAYAAAIEFGVYATKNITKQIIDEAINKLFEGSPYGAAIKAAKATRSLLALSIDYSGQKNAEYDVLVYARMNNSIEHLLNEKIDYSNNTVKKEDINRVITLLTDLYQVRILGVKRQCDSTQYKGIEKYIVDNTIYFINGYSPNEVEKNKASKVVIDLINEADNQRIEISSKLHYRFSWDVFEEQYIPAGAVFYGYQEKMGQINTNIKDSKCLIINPKSSYTFYFLTTGVNTVRFKVELMDTKGNVVSSKTSNYLNTSGMVKYNYIPDYRENPGFFAPNNMGYEIKISVIDKNENILGTSYSRALSGNQATSINQLIFGDTTSMAIDNTNHLLTWGNNDSYRLGRSGNNYIPLPISDDNGLVNIQTNNIKYASSGISHAVAVTTDYRLYGWGFGDDYRLNTSNYYVETPTEIIIPNQKVKYAECGYYTTAIITVSNELYVFGLDYYTYAPYKDENGNYGPAKIDVDGKEVKDVSAGRYVIYIVTFDGMLYRYGGSKDPQLVDTNGKKVKSVVADDNHGLVLFTDGSLYVIDDMYTNSMTQITVPKDKVIKSIAVGWNDYAFITTDGHLYTWGNNNYGKLGLGDTEYRSLPTEVNVAGKKVVSVSLGSNHGGCITSDGDVYTWGKGDYGRLGNRTDDGSTTPINVSFYF